MKGIVAAFAVLALSACGGGGGGDAAQTAKPAPKAVTIDAEGDSTMLGFEGGGVTAPSVLQAGLTTSLGSGITVVNSGVMVATAPESVNGTAPYTAPLSQRLAAIDSQIVIGNWGQNDVILSTQVDYQNALVTFIQTVRAAGKIPVLEEPNPSCLPVRGALTQYVQIMRNVAAQNNVLLINQYDYILSLPNWQEMIPDCIHPNGALYTIKGQREAAQLQTLVSSLR